MALTPSELKTSVASYVDAAKSAGTYTNDVDGYTGLAKTIGDIKTLHVPHADRLPELDGEGLPLGKIVEEYMVNEFLPEDYSYTDAAGKVNQKRPTFDQACFNYPLGRKKFGIARPLGEFYDQVSISSTGAADLATTDMISLMSSKAAWRYATKRQAIGNMITKAEDVEGLSEVLAVPTDTATGEAFVQRVQELVEIASDSNSQNLAGHFCGAAPSLMLYVKQGIIPSVRVNTLAGAFNKEELALGVDVKTLLDFGNADENVYAVLIDPRGIALRNCQDFTLSGTDENMGVINTVNHFDDEVFISKYGFVHVFKKA